jgi:AraC-like DNA-binding protein
MEFAIRLDQPDLARPGGSRRIVFGSDDAPMFAILNGRAASFEGGADAPDLSLKWMATGAADYVSGGRSHRLGGPTLLLLNRGQPYRMRMRGTAESFVVFFPRRAADAAWNALTGYATAMPEVPTVAAAYAPLQTHLRALHAACTATQPDPARLNEMLHALLGDVAGLAKLRRGQADRLPAMRRTTRAELLRRVLRAEAYLREMGARATLDGAADAAALSPFHLIRVFGAVFGATPLAYAASLRLDHARAELMVGGRTIAAIARDAGYASRTAFDRAFARRFGTTPGAARGDQIRNIGG